MGSSKTWYSFANLDNLSRCTRHYILADRCTVASQTYVQRVFTISTDYTTFTVIASVWWIMLQMEQMRQALERNRAVARQPVVVPI